MCLDELATRHGTDKSSSGHGYCPLYERYLGSLRYKPVFLLELGVETGASMRMWSDYFDHPDSLFFGVDLDLSKVTGFVDHRIQLIQANQVAPGLAALGHFNIVVDDCSHESDKTIDSFKNLWPALMPGGYYVIEDLSAPIVSAFLTVLADEMNAKLTNTPNVYENIEMNFHRDICFLKKVVTV